MFRGFPSLVLRQWGSASQSTFDVTPVMEDVPEGILSSSSWLILPQGTTKVP